MTPREAAEYLRLNPRTVTRLAREGKLPGVRVGKRWRFRRAELVGWSHGVGGGVKGGGEGRAAASVSIASMVTDELVITELGAGSTEEALEEMVLRLTEAGELDEPRLFYNLLLEREELMSTSIAVGVALPHPRRAVEGMVEESRVVVAVSREGVDFAGVEGEPVRLFFMICAASDREHLRILSRLSQLLRDTPIVERILGAKFSEEVTRVVAAQEESLREDAGLIAG